MKTSKIYSALVLSLSLVACSPKTYNSMIWQKGNTQIDGQDAEWPKPLRYFDNKSKLFYEVRNDRENLYIAFGANEMSTCMRAMQRGVKLSIDTARGREDYPLSITFPIRNRPNRDKPEFPERRDDKPFEPTSDNGFRPQKGPELIILEGFSSKGLDTIPAKVNKFNIEAQSDIKPKEFFCEMKIPFASFYKKTLSAVDSLKPLYFEVRLEAAKMNEMLMPQGMKDEMGGEGQPEGRHRGGMPPPGGGGMGMPPRGGGQGPDGGGGMPPMGENQNNSTPNIFRFELKPKIK